MNSSSLFADEILRRNAIALRTPPAPRAAPSPAIARARAEGRAASRAAVAEVIGLCTAAGRPEVAAEVLAHNGGPAEALALLAAGMPAATGDNPAAALRRYIDGLSPSQIEAGWDHAFALARSDVRPG